jgi:hypothetical protein
MTVGLRILHLSPHAGRGREQRERVRGSGTPQRKRPPLTPTLSSCRRRAFSTTRTGRGGTVRMPHGLAASLPEGFKERRERGRRSTAILSRHRAAFRRPRRLLAVPGVRSHRQRAHRSSPASRRTSRVHDLERLRTKVRRCRRASVRPVAIAHSPDRRPRNVRRAIPRVRRPRRYGRKPQPGTAPAPRSRSAAASHEDRGAGSVAPSNGAGIRCSASDAGTTRRGR